MFSHETLKMISNMLQEQLNDEIGLEGLRLQMHEKGTDFRALFHWFDKDEKGSFTLIDVLFFFF